MFTRCTELFMCPAGVIYMMRALGPAIGFPLAGAFSKIYVDFSGKQHNM